MTDCANYLEAGHKRISGIRGKPERVPFGTLSFCKCSMEALVERDGDA
jgi:hypothetical protein